MIWVDERVLGVPIKDYVWYLGLGFRIYDLG